MRANKIVQYLDVYVPGNVKPTDSVPVLAWWFGGGKDGFTTGNSAGLIQSSDKPIIYVASNYRWVSAHLFLLFFYLFESCTEDRF